MSDAQDSPSPGPADAFAVFRVLIDVPLAARAAKLDELCGENAALRAEVEDLLRHHDAPNSALAAVASREQRVPASVSATALPASGQAVVTLWTRLWLFGVIALVALLFAVLRFWLRWTLHERHDPTLPGATSPVHREHGGGAGAARELVVARYRCAGIEPPVDGDVAFGADGAPTVAYAQGDAVVVASVPTGTVTARLHGGVAVSLPELSDDASAVAAWLEDAAGVATVVVWDLATSARRRACRVVGARPARLVWDAAARRVAWVAQGECAVLDVATGSVSRFDVEASVPPWFVADGDALWVGVRCYEFAVARLRDTAANADWVVPARAEPWRLEAVGERVVLVSAESAAAASVRIAGLPHDVAFAGDHSVFALATEDQLVFGDRDGPRGAVTIAARRAAINRAATLASALDATDAVLLVLPQRPSTR